MADDDIKVIIKKNISLATGNTPDFMQQHFFSGEYSHLRLSNHHQGINSKKHLS
jgi:hypothetical protein